MKLQWYQYENLNDRFSNFSFSTDNKIIYALYKYLSSIFLYTLIKPTNIIFYSTNTLSKK